MEIQIQILQKTVTLALPHGQTVTMSQTAGCNTRATDSEQLHTLAYLLKQVNKCTFAKQMFKYIFNHAFFTSTAINSL